MAAFLGMHVSPAIIAMRDYQESVTTGQTGRQTDRQPTDGQTDAGQSDPYVPHVPVCFEGDTKTT